MTSKTDRLKDIYVKPRLRTHGSVEALTQAGVSGNFLDASFPAGTPFSQVTFS